MKFCLVHKYWKFWKNFLPSFNLFTSPSNERKIYARPQKNVFIQVCAAVYASTLLAESLIYEIYIQICYIYTILHTYININIIYKYIIYKWMYIYFTNYT